MRKQFCCQSKHDLAYKPFRCKSKKHCAYGHSVATLLNPRDVTTILHKYSLTVATHATVVVAVSSTVHYPVNYKIKINYFK
jgi:hypothetical protein